MKRNRTSNDVTVTATPLLQLTVTEHLSEEKLRDIKLNPDQVRIILLKIKILTRYWIEHQKLAFVLELLINIIFYLNAFVAVLIVLLLLVLHQLKLYFDKSRNVLVVILF